MAEKKEDFFLQIFNGTNYDKWRFRLKLYLEMKNCYEVITHELKPDKILEIDWKKMEVMAKNYIVNSVNNSQLELIISEESARNMLKRFDDTYLTKSSANKLLCKRKLLDLKMTESDNPTDFFNIFEKHINELKSAGENVSNDDKLNYLLLCLPECFSHIVDIVDALPEKEKSIEYIKSKLCLEHKKRENTSGLQSFNTESLKNKNKNTDKNSTICYGCQQRGHIQRECPNRNQDDQRGSYNWRGNNNWRGHSWRGNNNSRGHSWRGHSWRGNNNASTFSRGRGRGTYRAPRMAGNSTVQTVDDTSIFNVEVMTSQAQNENENKMDAKIVTWLLDSGCSDHIINDERYFCEYKTLEHPVDIKVGDGFSLKANKIGDIVMYWDNNGACQKTKIRNVYCVPSMKQNLLSVSSIASQNNLIIFNNDGAEIYGPGNNLIAVAVKKNKLFELTGEIGIDQKDAKSYVSVKA